MISKKNYKLEVVRGTAAFLVFLGHVLLIRPNFKYKGSLFINLLGNWGIESVIIFFMLSGIVINLSYKRNPRSAVSFLKNRLLRIYPLFFISIALGLAVLGILGIVLPSFPYLIGNLLLISTLQAYIVPTLSINGSIWSLTFEMFFYILFALIIFSKNLKNLYWWLLLALFAVLFNEHFCNGTGIFSQLVVLLGFSVIWLSGYLIYEYRNVISVDIFTAFFCIGLLPMVSRLHFNDNYYDPYKFILFSIVSIPFFIYILSNNSGRFKIHYTYLVPLYLLLAFLLLYTSHSLLESKMLYLFLPFISPMIAYFIRKLINRDVSYLKTFSWLGMKAGKYSYALYILHYPIIFFFCMTVHSNILYFLLSFLFVPLIAILAEKYIQPFIMRVLK